MFQRLQININEDRKTIDPVEFDRIVRLKFHGDTGAALKWVEAQGYTVVLFDAPPKPASNEIKEFIEFMGS